MSHVLASPLGDIVLQPVSARGWAVAGVAALVLHLLLAAGWFAWRAAHPDDARPDEDTLVTVALGPPGGRIDPPPAAPQTPETDLPKATRTERAADAPPIAKTAPAPPAPTNAPLSSGFGSGGDGMVEPEPAPAPPPPPPAEPAIDRAALRAYTAGVSQLIFEKVRYPESARREGVEGVAVLTMIINQRGEVEQFRLLQGTGHLALDEAILDAVRRVERFPRFPRGYREPTLRFSVRIRFTMLDME